MRTHAISRDLFAALAAGGGGPEAIRALTTAEDSKHGLLLRGIVHAAQAVGDDQARLTRHGWDALVAAERQAPDAVTQTLRYPSVGAWALRTLKALRGGASAPRAHPARLAAVAAAAAIRSGLDAEVQVRSEAGVIGLPSLGAARVNADVATVHSSAGRTEIRWARGQVAIPPDPQQDAPGWQGVRRVCAGNLDIGIDDLDPFRMPAVQGLASRLSAREAEEWTQAIQQGWRLLVADHAEVATEIAATTSVVVPLSPSVHGQLSSSSPETFGAIAMSQPADPHTCAVTLTHEVQHLKLGALLDIMRLTLTDDGRRYYAPWRDDPRPIAGLLQGAYAYLGVTGFWRIQRHVASGAARVRADGEFALWRAGTARVIDTLLSSQGLTTDGLDFVQRMSKTVTAWRDEPISADARAYALRESESHLIRWESHHGPVPA
ncbi:MAG TPA: HEXXH motif domain-containing protein [Chloroflexota bacterium]|nr:HEXXH motif domain-containing protein [Chloroflexota bacterium]